MHPYLTVDIPGTGGNIKESSDDFIVEEIPSYLPCGSGEHLYVTFEKRGITTLEAIRRISRELGIAERDIGYAGMKDAIGVTRQTISMQKITADDVMAQHPDNITMLSAARHTNKLKTGHLKGNRFSIRVREITDNSADNCNVILATLKQRGVPNYFGYQRYGALGNSHLIGAAMLRRDWRGAVTALMGDAHSARDEQWQTAIGDFHRGDYAAALIHMPRHCRTERDVLQRLESRPEAWEKAFSVIHPRLRKLYLSACQSFLFDKIVALRLEEIDHIMTGDLAWKHINGACFLVEDAAAETHRADSFEISASGPMFGCKMKQPSAGVLEMEQAILAAENLRAQDFDLGIGLRMEGERRPLRVPLEDATCNIEKNVLLLTFTLPKGSYATSVIREITKTF